MDNDTIEFELLNQIDIACNLKGDDLTFRTIIDYFNNLGYNYRLQLENLTQTIKEEGK